MQQPESEDPILTLWKNCLVQREKFSKMEKEMLSRCWALLGQVSSSDLFIGKLFLIERAIQQFVAVVQILAGRRQEDVRQLIEVIFLEGSKVILDENFSDLCDSNMSKRAFHHALKRGIEDTTYEPSLHKRFLLLESFYQHQWTHPILADMLGLTISDADGSEFAGLSDLPELSTLKLDILMENKAMNNSTDFESPRNMSEQITDTTAKTSPEMPRKTMAELNHVPSQSTTPFFDSDENNNEDKHSPSFPDLHSLPASGDYLMPSFQDCLPNFPQERPVTPVTAVTPAASSNNEPEYLIIDSSDDDTIVTKEQSLTSASSLYKFRNKTNYSTVNGKHCVDAHSNPLVKISASSQNFVVNKATACTKSYDGYMRGISVKKFYNSSAHLILGSQEEGKPGGNPITTNTPGQMLQTPRSRRCHLQSQLGKLEEPTQHLQEMATKIPAASAHEDTTIFSVTREKAIEHSQLSTQDTFTSSAKSQQEDVPYNNQKQKFISGEKNSHNRERLYATDEQMPASLTSKRIVNQDGIEKPAQQPCRPRSIWAALNAQIQPSKPKARRKPRDDHTSRSMSKSPFIAKKRSPKQTGKETVTSCCCNICGRKFISEQGRRNHYLVIHPGISLLDSFQELEYDGDDVEGKASTSFKALSRKQKKRQKRKKRNGMYHVGDLSDSDSEAGHLIESQLNIETEVTKSASTKKKSKSLAIKCNRKSCVQKKKTKSVSVIQDTESTVSKLKTKVSNSQKINKSKILQNMSDTSDIWQCILCKCLIRSAAEVFTHVQTKHGLKCCGTYRSVRRLSYCLVCTKCFGSKRSATRHCKEEHEHANQDELSLVAQMINFMGTIVPQFDEDNTGLLNDLGLNNDESSHSIKQKLPDLGGNYQNDTDVESEATQQEVKDEPFEKQHKASKGDDWRCMPCQQWIGLTTSAIRHAQQKHRLINCTSLEDVKIVSYCLICGNAYKLRKSALRHCRCIHSMCPAEARETLKPVFACLSEVKLQQNKEESTESGESLQSANDTGSVCQSNKKAVLTPVPNQNEMPDQKLLYKCRMCRSQKAEFLSKKKAIRHMQTVHCCKVKTLFCCSHCGRMLLSENGFHLHVRARHGSLTTSPICLSLAMEAKTGKIRTAPSAMMSGAEISGAGSEPNPIDLVHNDLDQGTPKCPSRPTPDLSDWDMNLLRKKRKRFHGEKARRIQYYSSSESDDEPLQYLSTMERNQLKKPRRKQSFDSTNTAIDKTAVDEREINIPQPTSAAKCGRNRMEKSENKCHLQSNTTAADDDAVVQCKNNPLPQKGSAALKRKPSVQSAGDGFAIVPKKIQANIQEKQPVKTREMAGVSYQLSVKRLALRASSRPKRRPVRFSPTKV